MGLRIRRNYSSAKPTIKITDELFETLLSYYDDYFKVKKTNPDTDMRNPLSSAFTDEFPAGDLANYALSDKQYKRILDYCFDEKYDKKNEGYFIGKYLFALKVFNFCISDDNKSFDKPTKREAKLYKLFLERLVNSGISAMDAIKNDIIRIGFFGLGKLSMEYLNKMDFYSKDSAKITDYFFRPDSGYEGFIYRDYDNARAFNLFLTEYLDDEVKEIFDIDKYLLPNNFPYAKEGKDEVSR